MPYRICKSFEIETAHMLSKHPEKCKFPHGHSRRLEVVLRADELDSADMVCDFKAVKLAVGDFIDSLDHAIFVNSRDPLLASLKAQPGVRLIVYDDQDPTTEVMAKHVFDYIRTALRCASGRTGVSAGQDGQGRPSHQPYPLSGKVKLERVRVWETSSSWAEYWEE
jgi:6-pyruvoyltetrahydropterin/6-carboxytetrahydropterin synthase